MAEDTRSWAVREGLSEPIIQALLVEGFSSTDSLKNLSLDDVIHLFKTTQQLNGKQCLDLKTAISRLAEEKPRQHRRKRGESSWDTLAMRKAVWSVLNEEQSMSDAAKLYGVPQTPLELEVAKYSYRKVSLVLGNKGKSDSRPQRPASGASQGTSFPRSSSFGNYANTSSNDQWASFPRSSSAGTRGNTSSNDPWASFPSSTGTRGCTSSNEQRVHPANRGAYSSKKDAYPIASASSARSSKHQSSSNDPSSGFRNLRVQDDAQDDKGARAQAALKPTGFFQGFKERMFGSTPREPNEEFRFLMLGKAGSGKSTSGNTILGEKKFKTGISFVSVTKECELHRISKPGMNIEIMDCPGLYDPERSQGDVATTIVQAVACMHPGPHAILYVSHINRYTDEEVGVFERLKALFDERITQYMIVLFTGGDGLEREGKTLADLIKEAPESLVKVAHECNHRLVVFNNIAKDTRFQVKHLLDVVRDMKRKHAEAPYYECPKYASIGIGVEREVEKRLAEVEKKNYEKERYIQELETKTKEATAAVEQAKTEMKRKEKERQVLQRKEKEKAEQLRQELRIKEQEMSVEKQKAEEKQLFQLLANKEREFQLRLQQEREAERLKFQAILDHRDKLENDRAEQLKKLLEDREAAWLKQFKDFKDSVAKNQDKGWIEWAKGGVSSFVGWITGKNKKQKS